MSLVPAESYERAESISGDDERKERKLEEQLSYPFMDVAPALYNLPLVNPVPP
jgi:hypothetical protein